VQNDFPTSATIFCAIRLRHSVLLHLTEIFPEYYFKTPPEKDQPRIVQNGFSGFWTMFYILPPTKSNPQHNAVILLKLKITHQSIKVRPQKWRKRTPKK
jgi:hypothetical protein